MSPLPPSSYGLEQDKNEQDFVSYLWDKDSLKRCAEAHINKDGDFNFTYLIQKTTATLRKNDHSFELRGKLMVKGVKVQEVDNETGVWYD